MDYIITVREVSEQTTAVIRTRAGLSELPSVIPALCGEVWQVVTARGEYQPGRLLAMYTDSSDGFFTIEVGVEVGRQWDLENQQSEKGHRVEGSSLPAGKVLATTHLGPYQLLSEAHQAMERYCAENQITMAGPAWELYGHWTENEQELRTDICYLVK